MWTSEAAVFLDNSWAVMNFWAGKMTSAVCLSFQIQLERRKVLMLQQQLEQLDNKLGTTRNAMGSIFSAKEKAQALQKQIKILENRLEKQYIKYNEVCHV